MIKFTRAGKTFDIAVPRRDRKKDGAGARPQELPGPVGPAGHPGRGPGAARFHLQFHRRAPEDGAVVDPHQGLQAIADRRIAMTSPASFSDDPLRVLRAARFASVHGFAVDKAIYAKAQQGAAGRAQRRARRRRAVAGCCSSRRGPRWGCRSTSA